MKKNNLRLLFLLGLLLISCSSDRVTLVKNGMSDYVIARLDNTSKSELESAKKIQSYIQKISGVQLEIVNENFPILEKKKLVVGVDKELLTPHQISIQTGGGHLYITGGTEGALNDALYFFLEEYLGCKWYAPGVEDVPSMETITLNSINDSFVPEITTRTVHSELFYLNHDFADQLRVTYDAFPTYVPSARVHTFHTFMPEEVFYEDHPEYYALRDGKRLPTQLCLTNNEVLEIVKDSVNALFERHPHASVISVSQDDNQQYCQCQYCSRINKAEGSPAGTMIRFVNEVAKAFPDKTISTLAYQHTRKPPKVRPEENVLVTICSIECDRSAPIAEKCLDFTEDLVGWGKLTNNIRVWDYTTQFTNFLAPFPNLHTLQPNIQLFRDNNAKWVFEQHSNCPSELFELRSYITAKLLWNPNADFDELLEEFTNGYYQEAGPYIKKYIDLVHSKLIKDNDFFLFLYGDPSEAFDSYLSPKMLDQYSVLFNQAESAVASKPEILLRVKTARMGVDYARLEASRKNLTENYSLTETIDSGIQSINPQVALLLDNFSNTAKQNNITLMNEMGFTVKEYGSNYVSALETAKKTNKAKHKKVVSLTKPKKYANENPMVLTDGALGGSGFYSNWLGYEGTDMEIMVDLERPQTISSISMAFLQVTNHLVFFPSAVSYYGSYDNKNFTLIGTLKNPKPLTKKSKVNEILYFDLKFNPKKFRYIKAIAKNTKTPYWHHYAGLPSWVFADEIVID